MSLNFYLEVENWTFFIIFIGLLAFSISLIFLLIGFIVKKLKVIKYSLVGAALSVLLGAGGVVAMSQQDWSIPECHDKDGDVIEYDKRCRYP